MRRSRVAFALGVVVPLLVLGGCSDDDPEVKVAPSDSSSPTPTPSESSSPTGPTATSSPQSAQETFIGDFFAEVGRSTTTGDTSGFIAMTSPECENCQTLAGNVEAAYKDGGHVEGGRWTVLRARMVSESDDGPIWNVDVKTTRERWFDGSGDVIKIVRASTQHFGVILGLGSDRTVIREMRLRS